MKFEEYLTENSKLERVSKKLEKLTHDNDRASAYIIVAEVLGNKKIIEVMKGLKAIRDYEGGFDGPMSDYSYKMFTRMRTLGQKKYGEDDWNEYINQYL